MNKQVISIFSKWAPDHDDHELFCSGTNVWTKQEFETLFLGRPAEKKQKQINTDVEVITDKDYADLESTQSPGDIEES